MASFSLQFPSIIWLASFFSSSVFAQSRASSKLAQAVAFFFIAVGNQPAEIFKRAKQAVHLVLNNGPLVQGILIRNLEPCFFIGKGQVGVIVNNKVSLSVPLHDGVKILQGFIILFEFSIGYAPVKIRLLQFKAAFYQAAVHFYSLFEFTLPAQPVSLFKQLVIAQPAGSSRNTQQQQQNLDFGIHNKNRTDAINIQLNLNKPDG